MKVDKVVGGINYSKLGREFLSSLSRLVEVVVTNIPKGEWLRDFDVVDEDTVVVGTNRGLYVSTNGGKTFRKVASGRTDCVKATRVVAEKVFVTFSNGRATLYELENLEKLRLRFAGPEGDRILAIAENSDYIFFSGYGEKDGFGNAVFRSPDGVSWEKVWEIPAASDERHIHELSALPEVPEVWITTGDAWMAPWVSFDNGETFTRLADLSAPAFYPVCFGRDDRVDELSILATPKVVFCTRWIQLVLYSTPSTGAIVKQVRIPLGAGPFFHIENVYKNHAYSVHGYVFKTLPGSTRSSYRRGTGTLLMTDDYGATWYLVMQTPNYLSIPRVYRDTLFVVSGPTGIGYGRIFLIKMPVWQAVEMARKVPVVDIPIGSTPSLSGMVWFGSGELTYPVPFGRYSKATVRVEVSGEVNIEVYRSTVGHFNPDPTALHSDDKLIDTISFTSAGVATRTYENCGYLRFRTTTDRYVNIQVVLHD